MFSSFSVVAGASVRKSVYDDLALHNQFYESVYSLHLKEVLEATYTDEGEAFIKPYEMVTRADAAYMLYQILGYTPQNGKIFPDVKSDEWYYEAVSTVAAKEIVNGFTDGTFRPNEPLTRIQMSKIISKAFDYQLSTSPIIPFTDVNSQWAPYVEALYKNGVTTGVTPTQYLPNKQLTRAEMSAFLDRAYKKVPGITYNDFEVMNAINEATRKVRTIALQGLDMHYPNQRVEDIREDMSVVTMDPYLTQTLKDYKESCYGCDGASVQMDFDFGLPYSINSLSNGSMIVDAIVPATYYIAGYRGTIELIRVKGSWKIKSLFKQSFDDAPLKMTIEEATDYLSFRLPLYWNQEIDTIQHKGKDNLTGNEQFLVNGKVTYLFNVNTAEINVQ